MFNLGYYTPVLLLQAFCLYHSYKNNHEQKWFWIIIFFPFIGCLIYLYHHFYSRRAISNLAEGLKGVFNSNYTISKLEKELRFNNSYANRMNLADAYVDAGRLTEAIALYEEGLKGFKADDPALLKRLLNAHVQNQDIAAAIRYGKKLEGEKSFLQSEERISYAWALHQNGEVKAARQQFEEMDKPYTNYSHRLAYSKFLKAIGETEKAKALLTELHNEFEHMNKLERSQYHHVQRELKTVYQSMEG